METFSKSVELARLLKIHVAIDKSLSLLQVSKTLKLNKNKLFKIKLLYMEKLIKTC
jgi:hypothetical protein